MIPPRLERLCTLVCYCVCVLFGEAYNIASYVRCILGSIHEMDSAIHEIVGNPFVLWLAIWRCRGLWSVLYFQGIVVFRFGHENQLQNSLRMSCRPEIIPAYTALAMEYAVFDRWFSSVPASTQPNRLYVHSATSNGAMSNVRSRLIEGFPQKSIFESVEAAGLSFGIYYQNIPATLFFRNLRKLKYITNFHDYNLRFKLDAARGKLPNYCVIEQRYFASKAVPANDDHPSHDVAEGQKFVKEVYETLRTSPQWNEILFIITYDEHGGFYDHVATPVEDVPNPDGLIGAEPYFFDFMRLGVRVPTIMVSPWIEKGTGMRLRLLSSFETFTS